MVRSEQLEDGEVIMLDLDETLFVSVACGDRYELMNSPLSHCRVLTHTYQLLKYACAR